MSDFSRFVVKNQKENDAMRYFVTGGAGFIGSNLVDRLLKEGHEVVAYDNFSTGFEEFIAKAREAAQFTLIRNDILNLAELTKAMAASDFVFHLAANADVRFGTEHPSKDLEQNTIATFNVLEAMRKNNIKQIAFSSTGSIYGEPAVFPTPENTAFPVQTSLYGASKLAGEGLVEAYCEGFGFKAWIFRFVSVLGERYPHGHVLDFYKQLLDHPEKLYVLGDGRQKKSYIYVQDCIDAILIAIIKAQDKVNVFNLGTNEYCAVNDSIQWISRHLGLKPELIYTGGRRGWIGDSPFIFLETKKIVSLGWAPKLSIQAAIIKTLDYLMQHRFVLERRS
jgi:UDP-glucose 4-epimerase